MEGGSKDDDVTALLKRTRAARERVNSKLSNLGKLRYCQKIKFLAIRQAFFNTGRRKKLKLKLKTQGKNSTSGSPIFLYGKNFKVYISLFMPFLLTNISKFYQLRLFLPKILLFFGKLTTNLIRKT